MPRGRIAPDADFFDDHPANEQADSTSDDWGNDEWTPSPQPETDTADLHTGDDDFGDRFAGEYTQFPESPGGTPPDDIDYDAFDEPEPDSAFDSDKYLRTPQKPSRTAHGSRRRVLLAVTGAAAVAIGVAAATLFGSSDDPEAAPQQNLASPSSTAAAMVPTSTQVPSVTGNGPGDVTSGPGVIFGYTHAYYTKRDGKIAAEFLSPDQNTPAVSTAMQQAIDKLDSKLDYTMTVTSTNNPMMFDVSLKITASDQVPHTYNQQFTVVNRDGRYYLSDKRECGEQACAAP